MLPNEPFVLVLIEAGRDWLLDGLKVYSGL